MQQEKEKALEAIRSLIAYYISDFQKGRGYTGTSNAYRWSLLPQQWKLYRESHPATFRLKPSPKE